MIAVQTVAFGEAAEGIWGVAWLPHGHGEARLAIRRGDAQAILEGRLEAGEDGADWSFQGGDAALAIAAAGPERHGGGPGGLESTECPCSVSGELRIAGTSVAVTSAGWRSVAALEAELAAIDSMRWLAAWLGPGEGLSLTALRPRKARGQEADLVAATVIGDPSAPPIDDPRLSTTYGEDGLPSRAGLELWFEDRDENGSEEAPSHQYPRRAAGETAGRPIDWEADGFELHASFMNWRSHGHEGPGVYLLARRR